MIVKLGFAQYARSSLTGRKCDDGARADRR
jgi:hypothetical protein